MTLVAGHELFTIRRINRPQVLQGPEETVVVTSTGISEGCITRAAALCKIEKPVGHEKGSQGDIITFAPPLPDGDATLLGRIAANVRQVDCHHLGTPQALEEQMLLARIIVGAESQLQSGS
jgi:hypothetical protein